eukprot:jgi/Orpsp1_1/1178610/evm.model.c7180000066036.2
MMKLPERMFTKHLNNMVLLKILLWLQMIIKYNKRKSIESESNNFNGDNSNDKNSNNRSRSQSPIKNSVKRKDPDSEIVNEENDSIENKLLNSEEPNASQSHIIKFFCVIMVDLIIFPSINAQFQSYGEILNFEYFKSEKDENKWDLFLKIKCKEEKLIEIDNLNFIIADKTKISCKQIDETIFNKSVFEKKNLVDSNHDYIKSNQNNSLINEKNNKYDSYKNDNNNNDQYCLHNNNNNHNNDNDNNKSNNHHHSRDKNNIHHNKKRKYYHEFKKLLKKIYQQQQYSSSESDFLSEFESESGSESGGSELISKMDLDNNNTYHRNKRKKKNKKMHYLDVPHTSKKETELEKNENKNEKMDIDNDSKENNNQINRGDKENENNYKNPSSNNSNTANHPNIKDNPELFSWYCNSILESIHEVEEAFDKIFYSRCPERKNANWEDSRNSYNHYSNNCHFPGFDFNPYKMNHLESLLSPPSSSSSSSSSPSNFRSRSRSHSHSHSRSRFSNTHSNSHSSFNTSHSNSRSHSRSHSRSRSNSSFTPHDFYRKSPFPDLTYFNQFNIPNNNITYPFKPYSETIQKKSKHKHNHNYY